MFQALGLFAVVATLAVSFNNPRAFVWLGLGSLKVLICSAYDHLGLPNVISWAPDAIFVSMIATVMFCHIIENIKILYWEQALFRLACLSIVITAGKFLGIPFLKDVYLPVMIAFYAFSIVVIFANSLVKSGLINGQHKKNINDLLQLMGCSSDVMKHKGGAQRWL